MKTKRPLLSVAVLFMLLPSVASDFSADRQKAQEQSVFAAEQDYVGEPVRNPTELPLAALAALRSDEEITRCAVNEKLAPSEIPASWFVASAIHLHSPTARDFIVQARMMHESPSPNRCLSGANVMPFWVLVQTPQGYRLALSTVGNGLVVLKRRTNGYRDILASAAFAGAVHNVTYVWSGGKYSVGSRSSAHAR